MPLVPSICSSPYLCISTGHQSGITTDPPSGMSTCFLSDIRTDLPCISKGFPSGTCTGLSSGISTDPQGISTGFPSGIGTDSQSDIGTGFPSGKCTGFPSGISTEPPGISTDPHTAGKAILQASLQSFHWELVQTSSQP